MGEGDIDVAAAAPEEPKEETAATTSAAASFSLQAAPNPGWTPGQKQHNPFGHDRMLTFDPAALKSCYPLMSRGASSHYS